MPFNTVKGRNYRFSVDRFSSNVIIRLFSFRRWESFNSSNSLARPPFNAFNRRGDAVKQLSNGRPRIALFYFHCSFDALENRKPKRKTERMKTTMTTKNTIPENNNALGWSEREEVVSNVIDRHREHTEVHGENITLTIKERVYMLAYMSLCWRTAEI